MAENKKNKRTKKKPNLKPGKYSVTYAAKKHSFVLIVLVIVSICIMALSYYCVGVVERHSMDEIMEVRLDNLSTAAKESTTERDLIYNRFVTDCECKAQAVAVMIAQNPKLIADEIGLEELLAVTGVDEITIADENGEVVLTTSASFEEQIGLDDTFAQNADKKNYSGNIIAERNGKYVLICGVSRRDAAGILTITCSADVLRQVEEYTDISEVTSRFPLMEHGITAILDAETMQYISHTNSSLVGAVTEIESAEFNDDRGSFKCKLDDEDCYVKYQVDDGNIILAAIPEHELYEGRNNVLKWLVFACLMCCFAATLASRKVFLDKQNAIK